MLPHVQEEKKCTLLPRCRFREISFDASCAGGICTLLPYAGKQDSVLPHGQEKSTLCCPCEQPRLCIASCAGENYTYICYPCMQERNALVASCAGEQCTVLLLCAGERCTVLPLCAGEQCTVLPLCAGE